MPRQRAECPVCNARLPKDARFCPSCGNRVAEGETVRAELPPHETVAAPVDVVQVVPRWFGVAPPTLLFAVAAVSAVVAVVLLLLGDWIAGLLVLGLALLLTAAFLEAGRRKPDAQVVRTSVELFDSVRARAGVVARTWLTQSYARREVTRRRAELLRIAAERNAVLRTLGDAAYRGEDEGELRARIAALDERAEQLEGETREIVGTAQEQVSSAKLQVQPTEVRGPDRE
jgi:ElaB/YqjD/DUF883 family membrane-anchored ribosome-binding protein